jgi:hypothetical protein
LFPALKIVSNIEASKKKYAVEMSEPDISLNNYFHKLYSLTIRVEKLVTAASFSERAVFLPGQQRWEQQPAPVRGDPP